LAATAATIFGAVIVLVVSGFASFHLHNEIVN
jgi:hypothetical protein